MGKDTTIAWADHTFNYWHGCTKVGPGCEHCYAEKIKPLHWGQGIDRHLIGAQTRRAPLRWNEEASITGKRRVFCSSMSDIFDNEANAAWRADLFENIIKPTKNLRWQLLTKRVGNAFKMLPTDFPNGYEHVGLMATVVNQEEAARDIPKLIQLKKERGISWIGLSIEPMLEWIDLTEWIVHLDWIIVGGESGDDARPFNVRWAEQMIQDHSIYTAVFIKQVGCNPYLLTQSKRGDWPSHIKFRPAVIRSAAGFRIHGLIDYKQGEDPEDWPQYLRRRDYPAQLLT